MKDFCKRISKKIFIVSFMSAFAVCVLFIPVTAFFVTRTEIEPEEVFAEIPIILLPEATEPPPEEEVEEEPEEEIFGVPSVLTGLRIEEEYASRRPLGVVINNIRASHPQHGISSADIVYEMLAEGDVTRFVAIFQSEWPEKIGSVRSARDYFIDFAFNHDAIFVFHGASPGGHSHIRSTRIDNLDAGRLAQVFWRDRTYPDWFTRNTGTRAIEHSSFTGREQIETHLYEQDFRTEIGDDSAFGFAFNFGERKIASLGPANHIVVPFSQPYSRIFIFDEELEKYRVENPQGPHMDGETMSHVYVTNVLIQLVQMRQLGDYAGRRSITTVGSGRGYLITGGRHFPVLWEKESHTAPTVWTFENGDPLTMPPGRIWVCVFQDRGEVTIGSTPSEY